MSETELPKFQDLQHFNLKKTLHSKLQQEQSAAINLREIKRVNFTHNDKTIHFFQTEMLLQKYVENASSQSLSNQIKKSTDFFFAFLPPGDNEEF